MDTIKGGILHPKERRRVRCCLSTAASLGLAALILWGLVSSSDPKATLSKLNLTLVNENITTLYAEFHLTNGNNFRGFNYTEGWVEFFYIANDGNYWELNWDYIPKDYQGFKKSLDWNVTLNLSAWVLGDPKYSEPLKRRESRIYVSLYMGYWNAILFWNTKTTYYQWLEANAYVNDGFALNEVTPFRRMTNFTIGITT